MQSKLSSKSAANRRRPDRQAGLDRVEIQSRVCQLFIAGLGPTEIIRRCREFSIKISRQQVYQILHAAAEHLCFQYKAPLSVELEEQLRNTLRGLRVNLRIVHSLQLEHIAERAASELYEMITRSRDDEYHLGFAGGGLLDLTARLLSAKLRDGSAHLPKVLYFHSVIARFDDNPLMDPNSFVRYFIDPPLPLEVRFVGLMAPGFIDTTTVNVLRHTEGIKESFDRAKDLDVLVTSAGGHWNEGCSRLHQIYTGRKHHITLRRLTDAHCIGDLMWCPVGSDGPIVLAEGARAMTLVDLPQLPRFIGRGKRVMLVLAHCRTCNKPKSEILRALLRMQPPLISDLVCDSFTVRAVLEELAFGA